MINIFYRDGHLQGRMSGPMKVIENLERSLTDCGVEYSVNEEYYENNLILHWDTHHIETYHSLKNKDKLLVGPQIWPCLLYTSPSPRDQRGSRMPSSA